MTIARQLLEILVCSKCKGALTYRDQESALDCPACKLRDRKSTRLNSSH